MVSQLKAVDVVDRRYADAIYVAAERHGTALLAADARIERSGAPITCEIITVGPVGEEDPTHRVRPTADRRTGGRPPSVTFRRRP